MLRLFIKVFLFLSAYYPLEIILCLKYLHLQPIILLSVICGITLFIFLIFVIIYYHIKKLTTKTIEIDNVKNLTGESLNYVIPYIFAFADLSIKKWIDIAIAIMVFLVILIIYINSNLLYINPIFTLFGFKVFEVSTKHSETFIIISQYTLRKNKTVTIRRFDEGIFFGTRNKRNS